jgi:hypothetical protein
VQITEHSIGYLIVTFWGSKKDTVALVVFLAFLFHAFGLMAQNALMGRF